MKGDNRLKTTDMLYEGKAKIIYATEDPGLLVMKYKDEATALDGAKKGTIANKGLVNNRVSCLLFKLLEQHGVATHLVKQLDERSVLVKRMQMIPLEVVVRNMMAGSLAKKLGQEEGQVMAMPVLELYYKNDELHDPMINGYHARALGWATQEQLAVMEQKAGQINQILQPFFDSIGIILVDFKLEFGLAEGEILLGDEISPDSCRLWDKESMAKLDKDRFRRDLGQEAEAYQEVCQRVENALGN